jgi:hypothetical protein
MQNVSQVHLGEHPTKPLGAYLVEAGLINRNQLDRALDEQKTTGERLGEIVSSHGWVDRRTIEYLVKKVVMPERNTGSEKSYKVASYDPKSRDFGNFDGAVALENPPMLAEPAFSAQELQIAMPVKRIVQTLLGVVLFLGVAGLAVDVGLHIGIKNKLMESLWKLFHLNYEGNLPSWYSSMSLLFCAALLSIIAATKHIARNRYALHWKGLAIIFLALSIDEAVGFHERLTVPTRAVLNTGGLLHYAWVIPGAIFALGCGLAFLGLLMSLPAKTRYLFVLAGVVFVGGAIGMELLGGYIDNLYGSNNLLFSMQVVIEETLEMLGIWIFIYALLSYIKASFQEVPLRFRFQD